MGTKVRWLGTLVAGALPFVAGQGVAAAAFAEGEQSLTFTYQGAEVTCHLFGQSDVLDGDGSAASSTNAGSDPRCVGRLSVSVTYVDDAGVQRTSGSTTASGSDVDHAVQGVRDSFVATHTVVFSNCDSAQEPSCELSFKTTPK